ncbi:uncharacterized protein LOC117167292 isoform X2 [Belonocnema kinseyi]|uniref:uncharacterized protein LOC117167292 isoform X2 n=1 Tax=Belonocnema kinseyi TaxID=2817044 RepID=UPI00143D8F79|nr:uncharacterized protein LOC117167292 isoform X2 [Belonocnema kinseyi]
MWLNSQQYYGQYMPYYRQLKNNQPSSSSAEETSSKESVKNVNTNKNVNVVLNVNSEEVAQRLWQIIQDNLMQDPNKLSHVTQEQLKQAIMPIVSNTRRGLTTVPITEIGDKLEEITRKCLIMDNPKRPPVDREILTRDIVADMMSTIKNVVHKGQSHKEKVPTRRMMEHGGNPRKESAADNPYATFQVKIQRSEILKVIRSMI